MADRYDVIVIGGGPAGLAGAFWLARYRRSVRLFDAQDPRNKETWAVHGYLGLEEPPPLELRRVARLQAVSAGAEVEAAVVEKVEGGKDHFRVTLADGRAFAARRLLFATGLKDIVPEIPGFDDFYGTSIWHCPECDGPSVTGKKVGVIGWGKGIARYCMWMLTWTDALTVLTHSHPHGMDDEAWAALERFGIRLRTEAIVQLEGEDGQVRRAVFHDGGTEDFEALFFHIACGPGSTLPVDMECRADAEGILEVDNDFETSTPGVYAAGDITPGSRLAIRAAYEGTRAAIGIHKSLLEPGKRID
ncbi:MAG TPA: NAD(P)/FAD-dependent oxidoreductase [Longimicrobiaceae bacterium]|nr:NAD(P)/FAD-dependent oxidoreductase [Longimicrobiaceae bacterium]